MFTYALANRDQNFGLNELAAIQDVRNEYNLQDITDEPPSSAQSTNDRGKLHTFECLTKTEKHQKHINDLPAPTYNAYTTMDR